MSIANKAERTYLQEHGYREARGNSDAVVTLTALGPVARVTSMCGDSKNRHHLITYLINQRIGKLLKQEPPKKGRDGCAKKWALHKAVRRMFDLIEKSCGDRSGGMFLLKPARRLHVGNRLREHDDLHRVSPARAFDIASSIGIHVVLPRESASA